MRRDMSTVGRIFELCKNEFNVVWAEPGEQIRGRGCCDVVCSKRPSGAPSLVAPKYDADGVFECGFATPDMSRTRHNKYAGGAYRLGGERFLLLGRDPYSVDFSPNVFMTLCVIKEGFMVETGEFQVNMLGQITLVNNFFGRLPAGVTLDEHDLEEISEQRTWQIDHITGTLTVRVPLAQYRKVYDNSIMVPGERGKVYVKMRKNPDTPLVKGAGSERFEVNESKVLENLLEKALVRSRGR